MRKTIFFDLGNVLIFFDHRKMYKQVATLAGLGEDVTTRLMKEYGPLYEGGLIDSATVHQEICKVAKRFIDFEPLMQALSQIFQPNPPVISLALELKKRGHPLFLLSNTCEAHFIQARSQFDFLKEFDGYVLSYEVKAQKPEKKIFQTALQMAKCSPQDCFYVDDILPFVESARALNIDAEQYTNPLHLTNHLSSRGFI